MSYYEKNKKFNDYYYQNNFKQAETYLLKDKRAEKRKTKLIYFLNRGMLSHVMGNYAESNVFFEKAYVLSENLRKKEYADEALALISNPNMVDYKGEVFEIINMHYFKALNFAFQNNYQAAVVEARRINIQLNALSDKYVKNNRYRNDAFAHYLNGVLYESIRDYNNAFIAYRNAYNYYTNDYTKLYNLKPPIQLKEALLNSAYQMGFMNELKLFEDSFKLKHTFNTQDTLHDVFFIWHNGLGPIKEEWSINFYLIEGDGGELIFKNDEFGLSFPYRINNNEARKESLADLKIIRVAFPKYVERKPLFNNGKLIISDKEYQLEKLQDINAIAFKSLEDRMLREFGTALLRLSLKQAAELALRKSNDDVGAALGVLNSITEKADTRNWQILPHSIYAVRLKMPIGKHSIKFKTHSTIKGQTQLFDVTIHVQANRINFFTFTTSHTIL